MTEVMVGGAILAGVAVAGARLFKDQRQSQAKVDNDQVLQQFHMSFTKFVQDEKNCNATLSNWGWNGRQADQMATAPFAGNVYSCSNCSSNPSFNYDMSSSTAGTKYIGVGDWIENVNGGSTAARRLWRIKSMGWKEGFTPPTGTGTYMMQVTYEMDPSVAGSMATKKATVKKDIALNLRFNQDPSSSLRYLKECLSPKESAINNLEVDVCKTMTMVSSAGNIMSWSDNQQDCQVRGSTSQPVKDCSSANMVVAGIRSDGTVHCVELSHGVTPYTDIMDNTACAPGTSVRVDFDTVTKKLRARCN